MAAIPDWVGDHVGRGKVSVHFVVAEAAAVQNENVSSTVSTTLFLLLNPTLTAFVQRPSAYECRLQLRKNSCITYRYL